MLTPSMIEDRDGVRSILRWSGIMSKMASFLRRRTDDERAADLTQMALILHKRSSTSRFDLLTVCHCGPAEKFCVQREGHPESTRKFETYRNAADYVRKFYHNLLFEGSSDAPNDIFLDSMNSVTKKKDGE